MKNIEHLQPMEIEKRSFEIISEELEKMHVCLPKEQEMITKRVIHTSADFEYVDTLMYSKDAVAIARKLIADDVAPGSTLTVDYDGKKLVCNES